MDLVNKLSEKNSRHFAEMCRMIREKTLRTQPFYLQIVYRAPPCLARRRRRGT